VSAYTDQHEIEQLKAWWKEYGTALIAGVLLGTALLFGIKYWRQYQEQQRVDASALYTQMVDAAQQNRADAVREIGGRLIADYAATPYAAAAGLHLAQVLYRAGKADEAMQQLQWVTDNAADTAVAHAARLRHGRLLMAAGKPEAALLLMNAKASDGFQAEYEELRGDVLVALKRPEEAREAYRKALAGAPGGNSYEHVLAMKLDELGAGKAP
jgi:predicted negative regulator of RcsB-dependent stress response